MMISRAIDIVKL